MPKCSTWNILSFADQNCSTWNNLAQLGRSFRRTPPFDKQATREMTVRLSNCSTWNNSPKR